MSKRINASTIILGVITVVLVLSGVILNSTSRKIEETISANAVEMEELRESFAGLKERIESDKEFEKEYNTFISELQEKRDNIDKKYDKLDTIEETQEYVQEVKELSDEYLNWCKENGITE